MNFDKEAKSDKKKFLGKVGGGWGWRGGGSGGGGAKGLPGTETKTVCQTVSNEVNTKMQLSAQCTACGTINISK